GADAEEGRGASGDPLAAVAEDRSWGGGCDAEDVSAAQQGAGRGRRRAASRLSAGAGARADVAAAALVSIAAVTLAGAACGAPPLSSSDPADTLFRQGLAALDAGKLEEARDKLALSAGIGRHVRGTRSSVISMCGMLDMQAFP